MEAPHFPFDAPEEDWQRWKDKTPVVPPNFDLVQAEKRKLNGTNSVQFMDDYRSYFAMIENLDRNMGKLADFLERSGLKDDTAIVFTSDHGEMMGSHGLTGKSVPYEESVGVPLIISYRNGGVLPGGVYELPTSTIDLRPTLLGLAGAAPSTSHPGIDLLPLATGRSHVQEREGILLEGTAIIEYGDERFTWAWRGWRTERYKYTLIGNQFGSKPWQLFDLHEDPYERNNLIDDDRHKDIIGQLHGRIMEAMLQAEDHFAAAAAFNISLQGKSKPI